jgi:hypothetical protein
LILSYSIWYVMFACTPTQAEKVYVVSGCDCPTPLEDLPAQQTKALKR